MHWAWKNCISAWAGMFTGKEGTSTVVLEAVADSACRFWHFFFGMPGSLNDLNVLDRSPLLNDAIAGRSASVSYTVNGRQYSVPYWLADGIYPKHHCFVKTIASPQTRKEKLFSTMQESKRKDIERAFGILQSRFHIITVPCKLWSRDAMCTVMKTCVILHNMIVDYEQSHGLDPGYIGDEAFAPENPISIVGRESNVPLSMEEKLIELSKIRDPSVHSQLISDLMEHLWQWVGDNE